MKRGLWLFAGDNLPTIHHPHFSHTHSHAHTHLWFHGAVDGWGAGGLHASTAEGLGAGREGRVRDAVGHFVLQCRGALSVQLRSLLHLGQVTHQRHSQRTTEHNRSPRSIPHASLTSHQTISPSHKHVYDSHALL